VAAEGGFQFGLLAGVPFPKKLAIPVEHHGGRVPFYGEEIADTSRCGSRFHIDGVIDSVAACVTLGGLQPLFQRQLIAKYSHDLETCGAVAGLQVLEDGHHGAAVGTIAGDKLQNHDAGGTIARETPGALQGIDQHHREGLPHLGLGGG
jgi:hypothetical protein